MPQVRMRRDGEGRSIAVDRIEETHVLGNLGKEAPSPHTTQGPAGALCNRVTYVVFVVARVQVLVMGRGPSLTLAWGAPIQV